jgi:hypothetical protein
MSETISSTSRLLFLRRYLVVALKEKCQKWNALTVGWQGSKIEVKKAIRKALLEGPVGGIMLRMCQTFPPVITALR